VVAEDPINKDTAMKKESSDSGKSEGTTSSEATVRVDLLISSQSLEGVVRCALFKSNLSERDEERILAIVSGFVTTLQELGFERISLSGDP